MRPLSATLFAALLCACAEDPEEIPPPDDPGSACGTPEYGLSLRFVGRTGESAERPAVGADIVLEDRAVSPAEILGRAVSEAGGTFTLDATEITSIPDCWLTLLDYRLVSTTEDGLRGELQVNRFMWDALENDEDAVDLTTRPIVLEADE